MRKYNYIIGLVIWAALGLGVSSCTFVDGSCFDFCGDGIFTIQEAIDLAQPGDVIFIRRGVYSPSSNGEIFPIHMRSGVSVIGEDPINTILDAEGSNSVLNLFQFNKAKVANFTIRGGINKLGGGIHVQNSGGNIQNLYITANRASEAGSGIYILNSKGFTANNLIVVGNAGTFNAVDDPAQVDIDGSSPTFNNNVVAGGDADGVRLNFGSSGSYENNIFFDNGFGGFGVGLADNSAQSSAKLLFNISFSNAEGDFFLNGFVRTAAMANSFLPDDLIAENFNANPLFHNPGAGDFTLEASSSARKAGDPNPAFNNPDGSRNDIGAYGGPHSLF